MNDSEMLSIFWEGISACFAKNKVNTNLSEQIRGGNMGKVDKEQPIRLEHGSAQCNVLNGGSDPSFIYMVENIPWILLFLVLMIANKTYCVTFGALHWLGSICLCLVKTGLERVGLICLSLAKTVWFGWFTCLGLLKVNIKDVWFGFKNPP